MSREEISTNYAQAIYHMALEEWASWLESVRERLQDDEALAGFLSSSEVSPAEKLRRLESILPQDASPKFRQFLGFVVDKGDVDALDEIISSFQRVVARGPAREVARITSAAELTPAERSAIEERLRRRFGAGLDYEYAVDPSLLGGVRIRVGDTVIDGTVAGRLATLRERLVAS